MLLTVPTLNNYSVGLGLGLALRRPVTQFSSSHQTQRLNSFLRWFSPVRTMSTDGLKGPLVGPQQLHQLMNTEGGELVILDASWYMDKSRNAYKEYVEVRMLHLSYPSPRKCFSGCAFVLCLLCAVPYPRCSLLRY